MKKRYKQIWDPKIGHPVLREIKANEKWKFDFGESIGMLTFGQWYPAIRPGHQSHMSTYDFPIRLKFIESPLPPDNIDPTEERKCRGWNLSEWIKGAKELEEEGVKAIVTGCGITGTIQRELSNSVNIPVFTSTILFVPLIYHSLNHRKKVGILTVSSKLVTRWDNMLLKECGVSESIPLVISGISESEDCKIWWSQLNDGFDQKKVEESIVGVALKMISEEPEVGAIVCECTEMPPYSKAIKSATGLPVFDAVDMVNYVYGLVKNGRILEQNSLA